MKKALLVMFENNIIFKRMRQHKFLLIIALCMSFVLSCSSDNGGSGVGKKGETLRFVFLADSPSDSYGDPPAPANFINTPVLDAIVTQILALSPRPNFVIFGGDMTYRGHYQHSSTSFYTFQAFKDVMEPLTAAGIPVYTAMGNHELYDTHGGTFVLANQTEFQAVFTDNSSNGPSGYERLVYSFTSPGGDAFFAVLDPYYITADIPDTNLSGNIDDTQLSWLANQVAQTTVNSYGGNTGAYSIIDSFTIEKSASPQVVSQRRKGDKLAMFISR